MTRSGSTADQARRRRHRQHFCGRDPCREYRPAQTDNFHGTKAGKSWLYGSWDCLRKREKGVRKGDDWLVRQIAVLLRQEDIIMAAAISTARLEARISTDLHSMLKRAAELQGRTMTDFVVAAVQDAAERAIEQAEVIRLSLADQECFAQALLSPKKPSPALKRAFARRKKLLRAE
jgi:uncharacterized protein (DUF1778 family)